MFVFTECDADRFLILFQIKNTGFGFSHFRSLKLESCQFRFSTIVSPSEVFQHVIRFVLPTLHDQPCRWFWYEREGDQKQSGRHGTQYRDDVQVIGESCKRSVCVSIQQSYCVVQLVISILPSHLSNEIMCSDSQNYLIRFFIDNSLYSLRYWIFDAIDANVA